MTRVLYIEDEPNNRMLVRRLFMAMASDLVYVESDNARAGIQMAIETPPDLILMDISMPDMDGLTATGVIRKTDSIKDMPIIALTANAMEGDRERFLAAGCDGYISKPIDIDTFIDNVRDYIKRIPEIKSKWASKTTDEQNGAANSTQTRPVTQSTRPKDLDAAIAAMSASKPSAAPPSAPAATTPPTPAPPVPSVVSPPAPPATPTPSVSAPVAPSATPPAKSVEPTPAASPSASTPVVTPTPEVKSAEPAVTPPVIPAPRVTTPVQTTTQQGTPTPAPAQPIPPSAETSAPVTPKSQDAVEPQAANTPAKVEGTSAKQQELSSNGGGQ